MTLVSPLMPLTPVAKQNRRTDLTYSPHSPSQIVFQHNERETRPVTDCRHRRTVLHLSYYASPFGPAKLVTHRLPTWLTTKRLSPLSIPSSKLPSRSQALESQHSLSCGARRTDP